MDYDLSRIGEAFQIPADFVAARPYGSGHINDTFSAVYEQGGTPLRYIHQRINHQIFRDVPALMENIQRVTGHTRAKLQDAGVDEISRRVLTIIPARDGRPYHVDAAGNFWRTYVFVEIARTYDIIESTEQAFEAARAFGQFQKLLADLPAPRLHETIPGFHHTRQRFDTLQQAITADVASRAAQVKAQIDFVNAREALVDVLLDLQAAGRIPERITHNDTKLNNVMIDEQTGEGVCVIDLDTVMPGLALYDFGDMVRTAVRPTPEDEQDLAKVTARLDMFEAIARGYLKSAGEFLTPTEKEYLAFSAKLITLEIGIRFLTDYLQGDVYFKTHRPGHNLDRCKVQLKMVESLEEHEEEMAGFVRSAAE